MCFRVIRAGAAAAGLLALLWLGSCPAAPGGDSPGDDSPGDESGLSRFQRTVLALQAAGPDARSRFATIALSELAEVHMAEADLARKEALESPTEGKLVGWSGAVDRFASQLLLVLEDIDQGYPVGLDLQREGAVAVHSGGRLVLLTHPRMRQQPAFEQRVLEAFCSRNDCTGLTARSPPEEAIPLYAGQVTPTWSFTERGRVCSHAGISVHFASGSDLAALRDICRQFHAEVSALLTEIAWQQLHGANIEWPELSTSPTPGQPEHLVRLNTEGDSVLVSLPLLHASPELLQLLTPWLQARSGGGRAELAIDGSRWLGGP